MELCTARAISNPTTLFASSSPIPSTQRPITRTALAARRISSRLVYLSSTLPRATSKKASDRYVDETLEGVTPEKDGYKETAQTEGIDFGDFPVNGTQMSEFFDNFKVMNPFQLDLDDTYSLFLYGSGAFAALYLASAVVSAIDSIPLFPKLMEVVGLSYSLWFTYRYLLFKKNRDELAEKIEDLKQKVLGSKD